MHTWLDNTMNQFSRNIIVLLYKKNHVHKCSPSPLAAPESVASETYFYVISIQFAKTIASDGRY